MIELSSLLSGMFMQIVFVVSLLFWVGLVYSLFLYFRFDKIKAWFNRQAGEEIVPYFIFRPFRTLFITGFIALAVFYGFLFTYGLIIDVPDPTEEESARIFLAAICIIAAYPLWRIIRRIYTVFFTGGNRRSKIWRMIYDILLNLSIPGGFMMLVGGSFVAVILSFTSWNGIIPRKLYQLSGVNVVPANIYYYGIGIVLGLMVVVAQFVSTDTQDTMVAIAAVGLFAFTAYMLFRLFRTKGEQRRQVAWQCGYMLFTTYAVFTLTWLLVVLVVILLIIGVALGTATNTLANSAAGGGGGTGGSSGVSASSEHQCARCAHFDSENWQCGLFDRPTKASGSCGNFQYR